MYAEKKVTLGRLLKGWFESKDRTSDRSYEIEFEIVVMRLNLRSLQELDL